MNRPVVLVTGATGFIGRNLVPLLDSRGFRVRRALREGRAGKDDVVVGSVGPSTDWGAALEGVHSVIHLAARVHHPNEEHAGGLYDAVNMQGTMQLGQAAARAGVSRFVFLSTILSMEARPTGGDLLRRTTQRCRAVSTESPRRPQRTLCGASGLNPKCR